MSDVKMGSPGNTLYPIFLKLNVLKVLIVGAGNVGLEKVSFMLKNSPDANIRVIGIEPKKELKELISKFENVTLEQKVFQEGDLEGVDLLVLATADLVCDTYIKSLAKKKGILCNVADNPALCDFYLGSIVSRGDLKVAISTNGKSPTLAKRIREYLEEALPNDTQAIIDNLGEIRSQLEGDFQAKLEALNQVTASMKAKKD